jgi:endogenous inhibitor of DNA gyrase (YacG/DUF329 family)
MQFYCPVCQATVETEPESTLTTKLGQVAYKSHCPTCGQDLSVVAQKPPLQDQPQIINAV